MIWRYLVTAVNIATCRDASIKFIDKNNNGIVDNAMVTIDGFLVSDNIAVTEIKTIGSAWSPKRKLTRKRPASRVRVCL